MNNELKKLKSRMERGIVNAEHYIELNRELGRDDSILGIRRDLAIEFYQAYRNNLGALFSSEAISELDQRMALATKTLDSCPIIGGEC